MAATFSLQIVTPDAKKFDGEAQEIMVRTVEGDVCILARHIDYVTPIGIGTAKVVDSEGKERFAACSGGMMTVSGGVVRVLPTTFEWSDEINLNRAEKAKENAEAKLAKMKHDDKQYAIMEAKLKRAMARIGSVKH